MSNKFNKGDELLLKLVQNLSNEIKNYAQIFFTLQKTLNNSIIRFDAVINPTSENKLKAVSLPSMDIISNEIKLTINNAKTRTKNIIQILKKLEMVLDQSKIECASCNGKGEIQVQSYYREEDLIQPYIISKNCPECEGKGYFEVSELVKQLTNQLMNGLKELKN
jgi:hypothetical protein